MGSHGSQPWDLYGRSFVGWVPEPLTPTGARAVPCHCGRASCAGGARLGHVATTSCAGGAAAAELPGGLGGSLDRLCVCCSFTLFLDCFNLL